jgi:hypothetical protein
MPKSKIPPKGVAEHELFTDTPTLPVRRSRSETYKTVYSNNVQVGVSYYDLRIHFNDVVAASKESIAVEELITVVLAPEQARDLLSALQRTMLQYTDKFGPLRPAPSGPAKETTSDSDKSSAT